MSIQTQHSKNHENRTRYGQGMPQTLCTSMLCNVSAHLLKHIPLQFRPSEEHFLSLPQFWTEFHDFFCILFGFANTVQICIVHIYPSTRSGTNEVNIFKLISLLSFYMFMDKRETLQTPSDHQSEDKTEKTGSISDTLQMICTGG